MHNRLFDAIGADPRIGGFRLTNAGDLTADVSMQVELAKGELALARGRLRSALVSAGGESAPRPLSVDEIVAVAAQVGRPLIYMLSTVYGVVALVAAPDATTHIVTLDGMNSDDTRALADASRDEAVSA